ncbi:MAG: hypothetical protein HY833_00110 [Candidatus Aenigmarchaeota archaeon]|nr:hypothetical protein [Candidatus Aenigmarchaeota archaeon]
MKIEDRGYSRKEIRSNVAAVLISDVLGRESKYGIPSAYVGPYSAWMQKKGLIDANGFVTEKGKSLVEAPAKRDDDIYSIIKKDSEVFVLSNLPEGPGSASLYKF